MAAPDRKLLTELVGSFLRAVYRPRFDYDTIARIDAITQSVEQRTEKITAKAQGRGMALDGIAKER